MDNISQNLKDNLQYLKLTHIYENYQDAVKHAARKKLDHLSFLNSLIEGEACSYKERSIERKIKNAKLPCIKTMEQFNWNHPKKINPLQIENLFHLNFILKKENIVLLGPCGVGKSHLGNALAEHACRNIGVSNSTFAEELGI